MKQFKRILTLCMALCLLAALANLGALASFAADGPVLTFTDSGITETAAGSGYAVSGTTLTISAAGTYTVTGSCAEGNIVVKKGTTGVTLILKDLTLASSSTAPLACNKTTAVTLQIEGAVTLTDKEDPANETSTDATVADAFEGAAIKAKSGSTLTITGTGTLTADGSACKNGVKGGATATVTVDMDGKLVIKAANNGLASDGEVIVKKGTLDITAGNEGIKAEPDADDADSKGEITIYGGTFTINAQSDGMQAAKLITISGGSFTINAQRDGIQSNGDLTISDGDFTIKTLSGYNSSGFNADTMSCKGLKASNSDEDVEDATNKITISGGSFSLNTRDDAVHSDGYIYITGGTFDIYTGDDGVHADSELHIGAAGGAERDPDIRVNASYEGLEAGNLFIYGGRCYVVASDDGINAAGGTSSDDHFNPWNPGGGWGGPGGGGSTGDYSLNISGGQVYVNANGDGLDSNGDLNLTGGTIEVWGQYNADNEPLDCDGTLTVKGATVFAAGSRGMGYPSPKNSQTYKNYTLSITAGKTVTVKNGSTVVYQTTAPKAAQFAFFSSPSMSTSWTCTVASSSVSCANGNSWAHSWNSGVVTTAATTEAAGVLTYTCSTCGATETQTIPMLTTVTEEDPGEDPVPTPDEGFVVSFATDAHSSLAVYATQDVTGEAILNVAQSGSGADVSRSSATGEPDSSGDGQVNFVVTVDKGYTIDAVTATEGAYKNIKLVASDAETNSYTYRVTKITAATTVSVATQASGSGAEEDLSTAYAVTLTADENSAIWIYKTQTMTGEADTVIAAGQTGTAYARDTQGKLDNSGNGQVNFIVVPAEGFAVDAVNATGSYKNLKGPEDTGIENGYRITKITAGDVAVSVTAKEVQSTDPTNPFEDVEAGRYYYDAVLWAVENGVTKGKDETHFSPNESCTRAQVVTFLWRANGSPEVTDVENVFTDVNETGYYYKAMLWAVSEGITKGTGATTFDPDGVCTRAQVVTFLWRAAGEPGGVSGTEEDELPAVSLGGDAECPFTDVNASAFYYQAMLWAVENGITKGKTGTTFAPGGECSRGEVVTFLYRAS